MIKDAEKTAKYNLLRLEIKQQYPGYVVKKFNMVNDVLEGWLVELKETVKDLVGQRSKLVLRRDTETDPVIQFEHCGSF